MMETPVAERLSSKKEKLTALVNSVLTNPLYREEIEKLASRLGLTQEAIIQDYVDYDMDIHAYGNEIYDPILNRIDVHIHNLLEKSWHQERQDCVLRFVKKTKAKTMIDIGFGVPTKYIKDFILPEKKTKLTLLDLTLSSIQFATCLLGLWDPAWETVISLKQADMQDIDILNKYDVYLFQDSIEHVPDPTQCLKNYVETSPESASFILSIPIGPLIKVHYMAWKDTQEAITWLNNCGLRIIESQLISVNPNVDLFAEQLQYDFHNFIVLCEKI